MFELADHPLWLILLAAIAHCIAIGTTALRARLLPAPLDAEAVGLLREYVQLRVDAADAPRRGAGLRRLR